MIDYHTRCGDNISSVVREVCAMASKTRQPVKFTFNDIQIVVLPDDHASTIEDLWRARTDARRLRYLLEQAVKQGWIPTRAAASLASNIHEEVSG